MEKTKSWNDIQKKIEMSEICNNFYKADYDKANDIINIMSSFFNTNTDKIKKLFSFRYIKNIKKEGLIDKLDFLKSIFNDKLLNLLQCDENNKYAGILSYQIETIKQKLDGLIDIFENDITSIIRLISHYHCYMYMSTNRIKEQIELLIIFFNISRNVLIEKLISYPNLIGVNLTTINEKIDDISSYLNCSTNDIKKMFLIYPPSMFFSSNYIHSILRFNKNRTDKNFKLILKHPYIINSITTVPNYEYCGFESIQQLSIIFDFINLTFGEILSVNQHKWSDKNPLVTYILTKTKKDNYCLISFGFKNIEEFLLQSIFKVNTPLSLNIYYQYIKLPNAIELEELFKIHYIIYEKSNCIKNNNLLIKIPYNIINENYEQLIKENEFIGNIECIVELNDNLTKNYLKYNEDLKNTNISKKELCENIFGNIENMVEYINNPK